MTTEEIVFAKWLFDAGRKAGECIEAEELELIMLDLKKLKTAVDNLQTSTAKGFAEVSKDVKALKDKLSEGDTVEQADLDAIVAKIDTVSSSIAALDPVPDEPAGTPV